MTSKHGAAAVLLLGQRHLENLVRVVIEELRTDRVDNARGPLCRIPLVPIKTCATQHVNNPGNVLNSLGYDPSWHYVVRQPLMPHGMPRTVLSPHSSSSRATLVPR